MYNLTTILFFLFQKGSNKKEKQKSDFADSQSFTGLLTNFAFSNLFFYATI